MPQSKLDRAIAEAISRGQDRGRAAASWIFDGNTDHATYAAFLKGSEDGDPAVLDRYAAPAWLSGEWAGESIPELLGDLLDRDDVDAAEIKDAYETAATDTYWQALERTARYHLGLDRPHIGKRSN